MEIHQRLRKIRESKKLSMKALSQLINTPERSISNYERGERKPSFEYIAKLTTHLNADANWILTEQGEMFLAPYYPQATYHKEHAEILSILQSLPEKSVKKLYHLAELERIECEKL